MKQLEPSINCHSDASEPAAVSAVSHSLTFGHWAIAMVFCIAVAVLSHFDTGAQHWIERHKTPQMMACFDSITFYGRTRYIIWPSIVACVIGWIAKQPSLKKVATRIILSMALSGLLVSFAKPIVARKEYFTAHRDDSHQSWLDRRWGRFPSGDSALAWSTSTVISLEYPMLAVPCYALASLTALGRVYRSAHLLADVVGGAGVGFTCAWWLKRRFG